MQASVKRILKKIIIIELVIALLLANVLTTGIYMKKAYAVDNQSANIISGEQNNVDHRNSNEQNNVDHRNSNEQNDVEHKISNEQNNVEPEALLEEEIITFIPYEMNYEEYVIMQTKLKAQISNYSEQIDKTSIEIEVPTIEGIKPNEIKVEANIGIATKEPKKIENFDENIYDEENNKLIINIENDTTELVEAQENREDEYIITYKYDMNEQQEETYEEMQNTEEQEIEVTENSSKIANKQEIKVMFKENLKITTHDNREMQATNEKEEILKEKIGNIAEIKVESSNEYLSKGYIYNNYDVEQKIETEYKEKINVKVNQFELAEKINIMQSTDKFLTEDEELEIPETNCTYFKQIKINTDELRDLFGEDGIIRIYNGVKLINLIELKIENEEENENQPKDKKENQQEDKTSDIIIDLQGIDTNDLRIETTKPIKNGSFEINIVKAIQPNLEYSKIQTIDFKNLELAVKANVLSQAKLIQIAEESEEENTINDISSNELSQINGLLQIEENISNTAIPLTEPETSAQISINKSFLSTVVLNEDVEIRAILNTNSLNNKLFKNPVLTITIPKYIENINIKKAEILFDDELKINSMSSKINEDGSKSIIIYIDGTQTKYNVGSVSGGTNVILTADIEVNKLTPNMQEKITMEYTNSNVIEKTMNILRQNQVPEQKQVETQIDFVAPVGVIATNSIMVQADNLKATSISGETGTITPELMTNAKTADIKMSVINNYNNTIENIEILGRFPFKNNTNIITGESLNSNVDMALEELITVNNVDAKLVDIYYSENAEATKDLSLKENGWTKTVTNMQNIKSYLIVIKDYALNPAQNIDFSYKAQVPANMQYNESSYQMYVVYFNNNNEKLRTIEDKTEATKAGFDTGLGPVLESEIKSNIEETQEVQAGNYIKYTATIKNTGTKEATNVVVKIPIPERVRYVVYNDETQRYQEKADEELTYEIGTINANETKTFTFEVKTLNPKYEDIVCDIEKHFTEARDENGELIEGMVHSYYQSEHTDDDYKTKIQMVANITSAELTTPIEVKSNENTIIRALFTIETSTNVIGVTELSENDEYKYNVKIQLTEPKLYETTVVTTTNAEGTVTKPQTEERTNEIEGVVAKIKIPTALEYKSSELKVGNSEGKVKEISYDDQTRELTINIGKMIGEELDEIDAVFTVREMPEGTYKEDIEMLTTVKGQNTKEVISNKISNVATKAFVTAKQTSTIAENSRLAGGDSFSYIIELKNVGERETDLITIENPVPENIQYITTNYIQDGVEQILSSVIDNKIIIPISLQKGETLQIYINVIAKHIAQDAKVTNTPTITSESLGEIQINSISHTIEMDPQVVNPSTPSGENKRISGQVWLDENKDGIKDENEPGMKNVSVMLFNNSTGSLVQDGNQNDLTKITDENGSYLFTNISTGSYTVIFLYNTGNYSSTTYRANNADGTKNSDAIDTEIELYGEKTIAAITEQIGVGTENVYNIDLGLIEDPKFDLRLEKTVENISVQNSTGTALYEYNSNFAKRDLTAAYVDQTTIAVRYKIKITNEGAVAGYAKKIADYIPQNLNFVSELNNNWYITENRVAINSSLANEKIEPGETKELTLILTKKVSDADMGQIRNTAEIYEAYNDLGLADVDSTPANKIENEDDISFADVLLSIRTGEMVMYTSLILITVSILAISIYLIKKKVLTK